MRIIAFIVGLAIAATGGAIAYRALFLEPSATVIITSTETHEAPDMMRLVGGIILLIFGAALAFLAARRKRA
jgi:drug/metabolite transporter (DMT)-like permease